MPDLAITEFSYCKCNCPIVRVTDYYLIGKGFNIIEIICGILLATTKTSSADHVECGALPGNLQSPSPQLTGLNAMSVRTLSKPPFSHSLPTDSDYSSYRDMIKSNG